MAGQVKRRKLTSAQRDANSLRAMVRDDQGTGTRETRDAVITIGARRILVSVTDTGRALVMVNGAKIRGGR